VIELVPKSCVDQLDPISLFAHGGPLHVDLGCGDGSFLFALAKRHPDKNFLGIERLLGRARSAAQKAVRLENLRVLRIESFYAVRFLLPPASVEAFYLLFPDPWPKRRHHRRRIVTSDFLRAISGALVENGMLHVATDQPDYFQHTRRCAQQSTEFAIKGGGCAQLPLSAFEKRFRCAGAQIYRLELRKISPVM
jgi:tRNA (guanine-N7-)-methyltransferase